MAANRPLEPFHRAKGRSDRTDLRRAVSLRLIGRALAEQQRIQCPCHIVAFDLSHAVKHRSALAVVARPRFFEQAQQKRAALAGGLDLLIDRHGSIPQACEPPSPRIA